MNVAIVGCRKFDQYEIVRDKVLSIFRKNVMPSQIISGAATGVDTLAKRFAFENDIPLQEYPAEWKKYGKSAGPIRNQKIVNASDMVIAFPSQSSRGTWNTVRLAKEKGIPVHVFKV